MCRSRTWMMWLGCALVACATTGTVAPADSPARAPADAPGATAASTAGLRLVGHATHYEPWCSGAAPPRGLDTRSYPLANADFVVKPGAENAEVAPLTTLHTDAEGRFALDLPPGTWCIVDSARGPRRPSQSLALPSPPRMAGDPECADQLWKTCLAVIDTRAAVKGELQLSTFGHCSWNQPCAPLGPAPP